MNECKYKNAAPRAAFTASEELTECKGIASGKCSCRCIYKHIKSMGVVWLTCFCRYTD